MISPTSTRTLAAFWLVLPLMLGTAGGCKHAASRPLARLAPAGWFGRLGCAQPEQTVCALDPACYGYAQTCWYPWPEGCDGCPPCLMPQAPIGYDAIGEMPEGGAAPPSDRPAPGPAQQGPPSVPPEADDWEALPVPEVPPEAIEGDGAGLPPPERPEVGREPSPFKEESPAPPQDTLPAPPEAESQLELQIEEPSPQPAADDGAGGPAGASTLRFVSFFVPGGDLAEMPGTTSETADEPTAELPEPAQSETDTAGAPEELLPEPAGLAAPAAEPLKLSVLEALSTSFSPPAPAKPAEKP